MKNEGMKLECIEGKAETHRPTTISIRDRMVLSKTHLPQSKPHAVHLVVRRHSVVGGTTPLSAVEELLRSLHNSRNQSEANIMN
jgi:hypothetical protein